jgi:UDP:flavonoid glycosyltransferase YjiC (YdhE family)
MRIFILTLGTRGDLELFVALGQELRRRGHEVTLGSSAFHAARACESGLDFVPVASGSQADLVRILQSLAPITDGRQRTYHIYTQWLQPLLREAIPNVTALATESDYFLSNLKLVLRRGNAVLPGAAVTYDPPGDIADLARYGTQEHGGRILELIALNRPLIDPGGAWDPAYKFTGFWESADRPPWAPPRELAAFLEDGPPPVAITLGSMALYDSARVLGLVASALRRAGTRGVLAAGWSGAAAGLHDDGRILCVEEVPYDWLFPRAACVVHHGGCGTVAAVLRAGSASVVLPQIMAQECFARVLLRERLAIASLGPAALTAETLASAIRRTLDDSSASESARHWQEVVAAEAGLRTAADFIEAHAQRVVT